LGYIAYNTKIGRQLCYATQVEGSAFVYVIVAAYPSLLAKLKLSCLCALPRGPRSAHRRPCNSCLPFFTSEIKKNL